jgi:hypothetical protein
MFMFIIPFDEEVFRIHLESHSRQLGMRTTTDRSRGAATATYSSWLTFTRANDQGGYSLRSTVKILEFARHKPIR